VSFFAAKRTVHPNALLAVLCAATFMSALDLFIVNVGLRAIGNDVGEASLSDLSWILNAYAIVFAALLVPAGRLADRYGVKPGFLIGLALFALGSLGCALSGDLRLIVALRCLQAVGAAALVPTSLGLILTAIPAERRANSIRLWAITGSLGAGAGPALGGLLVSLSWRWIFVVNVPIAISAFVAAALLAPDIRHKVETAVPDLLGGLVLVVAISALSLALVQGPGWGWGSSSTLGAFAVAVAGLVLFVLRSAHHRAPIVQLELFRYRAFAWSNLANFLLAIAFSAQLLGLVLWLQDGWHWSPLQTGLAVSPGPAMVTITSLGLRRYTAKLSVGRRAAAGALLIGTGGVLIGSTLTAHGAYAGEILPGWMIVGAGFGLSLPTLVGAATADLAAHQTSTGSAVLQMGRQIGGVFGVAMLIVILGATAPTTGTLGRFAHVWWAAGAFSLLAALAALQISRRRIRSSGLRGSGLPAVGTAAPQPLGLAAEDVATTA
jgi:EmrB/QacA subfamily drug resistance transporter